MKFPENYSIASRNDDLDAANLQTEEVPLAHEAARAVFYDKYVYGNFKMLGSNISKTFLWNSVKI